MNDVMLIIIDTNNVVPHFSSLYTQVLKLFISYFKQPQNYVKEVKLLFNSKYNNFIE